MAFRIGAGALTLGLCGAAIVSSLVALEGGNPPPAPAAVAPVIGSAHTVVGPQSIEPEQAAAVKPDAPLAPEPFVAVPALPLTPSPMSWPPEELAPKAGVLAVLAAALVDDKAVVLSVKAVIDGFPKPTRGDRAIAHAKGEAAANAVKENAQETAIALLTQAVAADPADAALRNELGHALMNFGKFDEAQKALVESITLDPGGASAWANLAVLLARGGDQDLATAAFVASVAFSRPEEKAIDYIASVSRSDNDGAAALAAARALESRIVREALAATPGKQGKIQPTPQ